VTTRLSYAVVTPARDEAENLARLAGSLDGQELRPRAWVIVDNGSSDSTATVAQRLAAEHGWVVAVEAPVPHGIERGGPVVRAFHVGLDALSERGPLPEVVVKVDADTSFPADHFRRLLDAFDADPRLGIASGSAWELESGSWTQHHMTGDSVWGAARAYRRECLDDVLPLEERMGWDGIDAYKASLAGWTTRTLTDLPFCHHRREGERDGARRRAWAAQGRASHYMGYRFPYLLARALHHARGERAAIWMAAGYLQALARREQRCADPVVRDAIRRDQRLRNLPRRVREAAGRRYAPGPG
jgi:glycosyltransferase involved in cell wall biosynthesis